MISGYLGRATSRQGDRAFSLAYADQNEQDHAALDRANPQRQGQGEFEDRG